MSMPWRRRPGFHGLDMRSSVSPVPYSLAPLRRDLPGFSVLLLPTRPYAAAYVPERHIVRFTFERQQGVDAFGGDVRRPFRAEPWRLAFTPAGCDVYSASNTGGEYLVLSIAPEAFAECFARYHPGRLVRFSNAIAPEFTPAALCLRRMIVAGERTGGLAIEEAGTGALELAAAHFGAKRPSKVGLGMHRLRRILDYFEANLGGEVRLVDLAREVHLSEPYLARAFKATTGMTLHAALMERRIARA